MKVYKSKKKQQEIVRTYDRLLEQWGVEIEELEIDTRYGMTHVVACGKKQNPPLLLFHGVGDDTALMWIYNAQYLSQYYRIYAVDTIGGPGKSVPGEGYNKEFDDVCWIDQILDALAIKETFLAGVSHGGYLVQLYSLCRPERVRRGISISSALSVGKKGGHMGRLGNKRRDLRRDAATVCTGSADCGLHCGRSAGLYLDQSLPHGSDYPRRGEDHAAGPRPRTHRRHGHHRIWRK